MKFNFVTNLLFIKMQLKYKTFLETTDFLLQIELDLR